VGDLSDPRKKDQCVYELEHLFWLGLLIFVLRLKSRWQLGSFSKRGNFLDNLNDLTDSNADNAAHPDTLNHLLKNLSPKETETLKVTMVKKLIRDKRVKSARIQGEYRVAIDATDLFTFDHRHCDQCLVTKHSSGKITYSHKVLEAKLITDEGMVVSVISEPIENPSGGFYDKQDCELKAFYRLAKRLRKLYLRTRFCLLMDGLYACKEVFDICKENFWSFIIVFKKGSIPTLWEKACDTVQSHPNNQLVTSDEKREQRFSWAHHLSHEGRIVHAIFCKETKTKEQADKTFVWLTDLRPNEGNVAELANRGGRARWKIENEGFNVQKNNDYDLEHVYGHHPNAWKNYYELLQIAHLIMQLTCCSDLCGKLQRHIGVNGPIRPFRKYYSSIKDFVICLRGAFRHLRFSLLATTLPGNIQIRFDTS
jgi:hypothetical protein